MKKILFATDFSEESQRSFPLVLEVAKKYGAEIVLLHINRIPHTYKFPYTANSFITEQKEVRESEEKLEEIFDTHFEYDNAIVNVKRKVLRDSSVTRGILRAAEEESVDLISLAIRGDNNSKERLFGSLIKELVRQSITPVLVIPENVQAINFDNLIFTTNLSPSEILPINAIVELFKPWTPNISIVHVSDTDDIAHELKLKDFKNLLSKYINYAHLEFYEIKSKNLFNALDEYIKSNKLDILSMTKHWHFSMFYRMFHTDLVEKMEFSSTIPVLSFNLSPVDSLIQEVTSHDSETRPSALNDEKSLDEVLLEITSLTEEIKDNYPELYRHLDEDPITIPAEDHPHINQSALEDYLASLHQLVNNHKEQLGEGITSSTA